MTKKIKLSLDSRIATAASLVRHGAVVADIGTDHGYLPITLLMDGKIPFAAASDLRPGPLNRAVANAKKYGVEDSIRFFCTDGLEGIPLAELHVTDIVICGMGGELISRILSESAYIRNSNMQLILQPMSAVEELRAYLASSGFAVCEERIACSKDKLYQCIVARYDGAPHFYTPAQLLLGKHILLRGTADTLFVPLLQKYIRKTQREYAGKMQGGADTEKSRNLLEELLQIAKEKGVDYERTGIF